jgi:hypothetical protein
MMPVEHAMNLTVLLIVVLLIVGWMATLVVLLLNRRTRAAGLVMLIASVVLPVVLLLVARLHFTAYVTYPPRRTETHQFTEVKAAPAAPRDRVKNRAEKPTAESTEARPAWIGVKPRLMGDVYQMSVMVGPYTTRHECDAHMGEPLQEALDRYAEICLGERPAERIVLPADWLRRQLVKDQWEEIGQYSVGPMTQLHLRLEFDRKLKDRVLEESRRAVVAGRLWYGGVGLAAVLAVLTGTWGYLKMTGR